MMGRRNVSMMRLGRCIAFLAAAAFFLPFTILLMFADQQYNLTYNSKRVFYQEYTDYIGSNDSLLPKEKFLEVNARMRARRDFLKAECSKTGLDDSSHKAYAWEYLINRQYHVIWCNVFKAASSSWMYNFNLMANYTAAYLDKTKEVYLELARRKYGRPTAEMLRKAQIDSISFIIVRHPLERLASAYNDKILHAWPKTLHDKLGRKIVQRYRKKNAVTGKPFPKQAYPVFEEFVSYVLDEKKAKRQLDMHWTPYTDFCTPCKFDFDVIMKFETLDEDQKFLIQLARLQSVVKPEWKNGFGNTRHDLHTLYSRLNRSQLHGLHELYKYDLRLFNYTMDNYFEMLKDGE